MSDWFTEITSQRTPITLQVTAVRVVIAGLMGLIVAAVYYGSQRRSAAEVFPVTVTMVLLTVLVAMTTLVIDDNVARAFSLVGALSIVRFRTVVDDTRDTAFVIFAVVVGMAVGTANFKVCLVGVPVVSLMALMLHGLENRFGLRAGERKLEIRVSRDSDPDTLLGEVFRQHLSSHQLIAATAARQGTSLDLAYRVHLTQPDAPLALVQALNRIEGVQGVDLKGG